MDIYGIFKHIPQITESSEDLFVTYIPGWWFQPLWKILVSWDDYSQYMEK